VNRYDAIVVGGGHNGLACAAYLARAGRTVVVLEERPIVGGFCTSEAVVPEAPGFLMNVTSIDHILTCIPTSVADDLDLARHGLEWVWPDPFCSYAAPEGGVIRFWRDMDRTCAEIARFSKRDADAYRRFIGILGDIWAVAAPYLQGHPTRPRPGTLAALARAAARGRRSLSPGVRILMSSPGAMIDEWFESTELKAALACYAVSTMASLDEPGSGLVLSLFAVMHKWGMHRPVGGSGALSEALAAAVRTAGGEIRMGTPVGQLLFDAAGAVVGVETRDGERLHASAVIAALDPTTLFRKLMPADRVPDQVDRELSSLGVLRNNISAFKGDVALARRPHIPAAGNSEEILPSCMLFAPSIDYVRRSVETTLQGRLPDELPMWVIAPSVLDRALVPPGSDGDSLYMFLPAVPYDLADGASWVDEKDKVLDRCLDVFDQYAPGAKASVIGASASGPHDFEAFSAVHKGHLFHADMTPAQAGPWRPTPSLSGYRTPVRGLWHTGAGAHPTGAINGWSGRTAARTILRATRR